MGSGLSAAVTTRSLTGRCSGPSSGVDVQAVAADPPRSVAPGGGNHHATGSNAKDLIDAAPVEQDGGLGW